MMHHLTSTTDALPFVLRLLLCVSAVYMVTWVAAAVLRK